MKEVVEIDLRKYFWRAAAICRRHGLKQSAVVIADNIDALTNAMIKRSGRSQSERPNRQAERQVN